MAATAVDIEEFLDGPLVIWLASCLHQPEKLTDYASLLDGSLIHEVILQIDPEPLHTITPPNNNNSSSQILTRIKNFDSIIKTIKALYEEELGQTVVHLPDPVCIGSEPNSITGLQHLRLTLLLLLGCAVQCPNKENFITRIKELPVNIQHDIVSCIKQVTDDQTIVLTSDTACTQDSETLLGHIRTLVSQRDICLQQWISSQISMMQIQAAVTPANGTSGPATPASGRRASSIASNEVESNHLAVELADWKARLRKLRQELEEKSEALTECKEELEYNNCVMAKLRAENGELLAEARRAKTYRDELDALREHAERADRLEAETQKYRERLADAEFYRQRVEELREDNRVLLDTQEMLESQLARARQRSENGPRLEAELLSRDQTINELILERDAARDKIQELIDENTRLQLVTKISSNIIKNDSESETEQINSGDNSLSEQLTNNAQARALKLELENRKLQRVIDNLKENSFQENSDKILELEKEKKKFSIKIEQLTENCTRITKQNSELENAFKTALDENLKLQESLDAGRIAIDRQSNEIQSERTKNQEFERTIETVNKEKQCIQALYDSVKVRANDLEKSLKDALKKNSELEDIASKSNESQIISKERGERISQLEKENTSLQKDVNKLKESQEGKNVALDQQIAMNEQQQKEILRLGKECEIATLQLQKLHDLEQKTQELLSQVAVSNETITTLQADLIGTKLSAEKLKNIFEKLGLNHSEILDCELTVDNIIQKMCANAEVIKIMKEILKDKGLVSECSENEDDLMQAEQVISSVSSEWKQQCEQLCMEVETLQTQNAKLEVEISTLTSQVNSLSTQHTALQLANSQLVAEKDELIKQQEINHTEHDTLLVDQATLRSLHEQLSTEYEGVNRDRELLKASMRDVRNELRDAKELNSQLEKKLTLTEQEKETLKTESRSLSNLRAEHSKLKEDFRNLFSANEIIKNEYRTLQELSRTARSEAGRFRLDITSLRDELAASHTETNRLRQKCEMLFSKATQLDEDRRALMSHAAQLLTQYHSLLSHALDGERSHHVEQRALTDQLHTLCRQKERLEDKIMEHYRKLDSCTSTKKKSFGASLVRRFRKASSDFINKVPGNRHSWQDDSRLSHSEFVSSQTGSGDSCNNDSDNSTEESFTNITTDQHDKNSTNFETRDNFNASVQRSDFAIRKSRRESSNRRSSLGSTTGSVLSLGSVGTRRTVYLAEQDTDTNNRSDAATSGAGTMLVYNRISTVIGGDGKSTIETNEKPSDQKNETDGKNFDGTMEKNANSISPTMNKTKENTIWYEYGCV